MQSYKVTINNYDLIGNDVNDTYRYGQFEFTGGRDKDADILAFLNEVYFNKRVNISRLAFDDNGYDTIYINKANGTPICEIVFEIPF